MKNTREDSARALADTCILAAKATLGPGWNHVSRTIQRALILDRVVSVIRCQDDSISPQAIHFLFNLLCARVDELYPVE